MTTMPEPQLKPVLAHYCELCANGDEATLKLGDEIMLHAFEHMNKDRTSNSRNFNLGNTLIKFRRLYIASRNKEPKMMFIKDQSEAVTAPAKTKSMTVVSSLRTGLLLYILLRTLSKEHYK